MGKIITDRFVHRLDRTRNPNRETAELIPAEEWMSEQRALAYLWRGTKNIPKNDDAMARAPLHFLETYGLICRRGGAGGISDGSEVYRYKSTEESVEQDNKPVAAYFPGKVHDVKIMVIDENGAYVEMYRNRDKEEISRIGRERAARRKQRIELGIDPARTRLVRDKKTNQWSRVPA